MDQRLCSLHTIDWLRSDRSLYRVGVEGGKVPDGPKGAFRWSTSRGSGLRRCIHRWSEFLLPSQYVPLDILDSL